MWSSDSDEDGDRLRERGVVTLSGRGRSRAEQASDALA